MRCALIVFALTCGPEQKQEVKLPDDSLYALKTKTLEGKETELKSYAGKVTLVVNLASQ